MYFGKDGGSVPHLTAEEENLILSNLHLFIEGFRHLENESNLVEVEKEADRLFCIKKIRDLLPSWSERGLDISWIEDHPDLFLEALNLYAHYKPIKKMLFRRLRGILCKFQEKEGI